MGGGSPMPLARILTHHPERASALSEQLQQQGYSVEVSRPDQTNLAPADLEIEFEICERADALERAAVVADELQADVAVAPGVLHAETEPVMAEAAVPEQASDREREFQAAFQPMQAEGEHVAEPAARAEVDEKQHPQLIDFPVMEQAPLPPVQFLDEPPVMKAEAFDWVIDRPAPTIETPRAADPVPYLAQLTPFGTPHAGNAEIFADREPDAHMQRQTAEAKPAGPAFRKRAADFVGKSIAAMKVGIAETAESFRENLKEYNKRAQVRSAEAHAKRVARMLDLEQRQAEAQARATELEVAREAAAARLTELLRERDPGLREEGLRQERLREEMLY